MAMPVLRSLKFDAYFYCTEIRNVINSNEIEATELSRIVFLLLLYFLAGLMNRTDEATWMMKLLQDQTAIKLPLTNQV